MNFELDSKINNAGIFVLGYTQALRPGVKASFGVAIDTQKLNSTDATGNSHKVGTSLVFEAVSFPFFAPPISARVIGDRRRTDKMR